MSIEETSHNHKHTLSKSTVSELLAVREESNESPMFLSKERIKESDGMFTGKR